MSERTGIDINELREVWWLLSAEDRLEGFGLLDRDEATEFFLDLDPHDQAALLLTLPRGERRLWIRSLAPDDAVDLIQELSEEERAASRRRAA